MDGSNKKVLVFVIAVAFLGAAVVFGLTRSQSSSQESMEKSFQAVELKSGNTIDFPKAFAGKKVALVFFSVG